MSGDIGREHWTVPANGMTGADPDATDPDATDPDAADSDAVVRLVACDDGSVALHLTCSGRKTRVRFDVSRAAQLSAGVWEAAQLAQRLKNRLGDDRSRPPPRPAARTTAAGEPAGSLASASSSGSPAPGRPLRDVGEGPTPGNEGAGMDAEEARTIGRRIHQIRTARGKSLQVVSDLVGTGMSRTKLNRIERGLRALTLTEIRALAGALQISPGELTKLPVPAPANGNTDSTINTILLAVMATSRNLP
ncbi:MAG: helix-turn-helix domain-containing protein, partial [Actinomycetes bacterium]